MLKETIRVFAVLLLFVIISSSQLSAQNPFNKGVNLTSWFQSGSAQEVQLYKYDLQDFEQIKSLGCDVIRLPVNLLAMTDGAPDYNLDPMFLSMMDSVVNWAENTGLHLILDNHTFDPSENTSPAIRDFLVKVWPQLANRYKNSYENLYYEILNEPHGIADATWNNIQQEVIEKIREVDAVHFLIVGPAGWNSYHNLELMPFYEDPKLIYTFHFYDPFLFTHQGASWVEPSMVPLAGVPFPYDAGAMPGMPAQFSGTWLQSAYNNYQNDGTVTKIKSLIDKAVTFKNQRNIKIFCGEFGVLNNNVDDQEDRNYWYQVVREYLEANDIAWTIWDYHGGFGLFEKNSQGLFDHDLNVDLLQALGLNQPDQTEFFIQADSSAIVIFDDYIGKGIYASHQNNGELSMYETDNPKEGSFYINWSDPVQYNAVGFDFQPNRDLTVLVNNDYSVDFWIKGNREGSSIDIRFIDSKKNDGTDRPWRIRYTIDEEEVVWNGEWQKISIPLKNFSEHGSWDNNQWYNPIGAFEWEDIDRFEIVNEYGLQLPVSLGFDQIQITGEPLTTFSSKSTVKAFIFPVPVRDILHVSNLPEGQSDYIIYNLFGQNLKQGFLSKTNTVNINSLDSGFYIINIHNIKYGSIALRFSKIR